MGEVRWGVRPSNGTDGQFRFEATCLGCTVDHDGGFHGGGEDGESCPIIMDALFGEHSYPNPQGPPQWGVSDEPPFYLCSAFQGPCSCAANGRSTEP